MRPFIFIVLLTAITARAQETFPILKAGSQVYSNVTVTSVSYSEIYFTSSSGFGVAKLKDLDPAVQKHFHFDAVAQKTGNVFRALVATNAAPATVAGAQAELDAAILRVKAIINQPVRRFRDTPGLQVENWPYWFHDGANRPDFRNVDIRTSQELPYAKFTYVTSNLNPGIVFVGAELEFNSNTKYFYTDRTLPKKKLTQAEMIEINRLYRLIAEDQEIIPDPPAQ